MVCNHAVGKKRGKTKSLVDVESSLIIYFWPNSDDPPYERSASLCISPWKLERHLQAWSGESLDAAVLRLVYTVPGSTAFSSLTSLVSCCDDVTVGATLAEARSHSHTVRVVNRCTIDCGASERCGSGLRSAGRPLGRLLTLYSFQMPVSKCQCVYRISIATQAADLSVCLRLHVHGVLSKLRPGRLLRIGSRCPRLGVQSFRMFYASG